MRIDQESDTAELAQLSKEQAQRDAAFARRPPLISRQDATALLPQIAGLETRVRSYPALQELYRRQKEAALAEKAQLEAWLLKEGESLSGNIREKMGARNQIIQSRLDALRSRRDAYTLRAVREGVVADVLMEPGIVVMEGQQVMRLVAARSDRVVGFLPEAFLTACARASRPRSGP